MTGGSLTWERDPDPVAALGRLVTICGACRAYLGWTISDLYDLVLPPLRHGQYCIFRCQNSDIAFVTWAFLAEGPAAYLRLGHDPRQYEWSSGTDLWITDLVTPAGRGSVIISCLVRDVLTPDYLSERGAAVVGDRYVAHAVRRSDGTTMRRIARFSRPTEHKELK